MSSTIFNDRFKGKVMIITGFATGIGKEAALRAAKEGAMLILVDKKEKESINTFDEVIKCGGEARMMIGDLSREHVAKEMVKLAVDTYGRLDIALNNAGVMGNPCSVHNLKEEDLDYTMNHNFKSVYFCAKAELEVLVAQGRGGVIVNNASIAGLIGLPGNAAYVASKHAVNGLTRNMALDYAKYNIRVNSVNPAGTDTPMVDEAMGFVKAQMQKAVTAGLDQSQVQSMAGQKTETMQKRNATAKEQAASMLFLASDDATHITGTLFATDGGWTAF